MNDVHPPMPAVREAVARALAEDLLPMGDITAALIPIDVLVRADVVAREEGVLAGRLCVNETFAQVDPADIQRIRNADLARFTLDRLVRIAYRLGRKVEKMKISDVRAGAAA